jgi:PAS domain S-box-containing protein
MLRHESVQGSIEGIYAEDNIEEELKTEEALRKSEAKFKGFFDRANDAMAFLDVSGRILDVNGKAIEMFAGSKEELLGKHFTRLGIISPKEVPAIISAFATALAGKKTTYAICIKNKKGHEINVEVSGSLMKLNGKLAGLLVIARDTTERKRTEDALRESEARFRNLLESADVGILTFDLRGRITSVNKKIEEISGLSRDDIVGKHTTQFARMGIIGLKEIPWLLKALAGRFRDQPTRVYEIKIKNKKGQEKLIDFRGSLIKQKGKPFEILEIIRDITERKKVEEALSESEEKYRTQFEEALDAIFLAEAETGVIIDCNRAASELVGRDKSELVGKHQRILHPPQEIEGEFSRTFKQHIKEKEGQVLETQVITKSGEIKDVAIKANVIELGNKKAILGVFRDITEQKKTEEALKESEERYRRLINGMNDTVEVIGFDGKFIDVNDASVKVLGYSREELLSMGPPDIDTSLTVEQIRDLIQRLPTDQVQVFETTHITKDGKTIPVEICSSLVTYQGKQAILSVGRDITERKKAEEKVRESEEKYRNLFENARDVILTLDLKGNVTSVNKAAVEYGFKLDEIVGKSVLKFIPKKYWPRILTAIANVARGKPVEGEIEILTPIGKQIAEYGGNPIKLGEKIVGLQAILRNITERKEMEEKLRQYSEHLEELVQKRTEELLESEKRYSVLVEEASDGVAILQDGRIVFTNKRGTEITGYPREEAIGLSFEKLVSEEYKQLTKERYERRMRGEIVPSQYEIELVAKTGNRIPVELSATRIQYQGRPADLLIVRDVRERKRMEEQHLKLEKLAAIGELATMVGHDLRNPLQSIENAAYYLKNEYAPKLAAPIPQRATEMFQVISDSVDYADKIVRDLQDFSAIKMPKLERTNINAMIKETLSRVHRRNNIELRTELGHLPEINVDKDEIKRVFMNLATNGIQAMDNGGTLTVATRKAEGFVEVSFKDTGIGISKENMEKLFTPFFTTKAKGMGVGLSICKKFVENHGGNIEVESEIGKGTVFTVKLLIHQEDGGEKT